MPPTKAASNWRLRQAETARDGAHQGAAEPLHADVVAGDRRRASRADRPRPAAASARTAGRRRRTPPGDGRRPDPCRCPPCRSPPRSAAGRSRDRRWGGTDRRCGAAASPSRHRAARTGAAGPRAPPAPHGTWPSRPRIDMNPTPAAACMIARSAASRAGPGGPKSGGHVDGRDHGGLLVGGDGASLVTADRLVEPPRASQAGPCRGRPARHVVGATARSVNPDALCRVRLIRCLACDTASGANPRKLMNGPARRRRTAGSGDVAHGR